MKMRRFYAPDMKTALRQVSDELGSDAAIMSTRKNKDGVEVIAALDYEGETHIPTLTKQKETETAKPNQPKVEWREEPSLVAIREEMALLKELLQEQLGELTWTDKKRREPVQSALTRRAVDMGFTPQIADQFAQRVTANEFESGWEQMRLDMAHAISTTPDTLMEQGGIYSLIGPTGVGKTTSLAKLAAHFVTRHGPESVALVTTDSYRIAAHEQLRTYANIMNVPMRVADNAEHLQAILDEFSNKKLVLIDTAGISQRDKRLAQQMSCLTNTTADIKSLLVLSTTSQTAVLRQAIKTFSAVPMHGVILTKLDETQSLGESLSAVIGNQLKVTYTTDGQRVPEDIALADANLLLKLASEMENEKQHDWVTAMRRQLG